MAVEALKALVFEDDEMRQNKYRKVANISAIQLTRQKIHESQIRSRFCVTFFDV